MKKITQFMFLLGLVANVACAENAKSPVAPLGGSSEAPNNSAGEEDHIELMALTYKGIDLDGADCSLHISALEDEKHDHKYIVKIDYSLHGEVPQDTIVSFERYSLKDKKYYAIDSDQAGSAPVIASAVLKDEDAVVDFNQLLAYEQSGELVQSLRADLKNIDFDTFELALESVMDDNKTLSAHKENLDQLQRMVFKLAHAGHYDSVACFNFELTGLTEVDFKLGGDHDGDHDHDH